MPEHLKVRPRFIECLLSVSASGLEDRPVVIMVLGLLVFESGALISELSQLTIGIRIISIICSLSHLGISGVALMIPPRL